MQDPRLLRPTARPKRRPGIREFAVGDELILFTPTQGGTSTSPNGNDQALTLNSSGRAVWELCDGRNSFDDVLRVLQSRYNGDADGLREGVAAALLRLRTLDMLDLEDDQAADRGAVKIVVGVEDKAYFHWQLPILFESLLGRLPTNWDICVVVCNNHEAFSEPFHHIFNTYNVKFVTAPDKPSNERIDFADKGERYVPMNRIQALATVADLVGDDDMVCLMDTDVFLYKELDTSVFPTRNTISSNWIVNQKPFFSFGSETEGVDLHKLLDAFGCTTPFQAGGVNLFLTGATIKNEKFIHDCFRFTQILYLAGKIIEVPKVWISEMACFALALTANGIPYEVADLDAFAVSNFDAEQIPPGTFYHYYHDLKDGGDGAFKHSKWHKQLYFHSDFLKSDFDEFQREAVSDHERYFFELAKHGRQRLYAADAPGTGGTDR